METRLTSNSGFHLRDGAPITLEHFVADHKPEGYPVLSIGESHCDDAALTIWPTPKTLAALAMECALYLAEHDEHAAYELEAALARHRGRQTAGRRPVPAEAATGCEELPAKIASAVGPGTAVSRVAANGKYPAGYRYSSPAGGTVDADDLIDSMASTYDVRRAQAEYDARTEAEIAQSGATNCPREVP